MHPDGGVGNVEEFAGLELGGVEGDGAVGVPGDAGVGLDAGADGVLEAWRILADDLFAAFVEALGVLALDDVGAQAGAVGGEALVVADALYGDGEVFADFDEVIR